MRRLRIAYNEGQEPLEVLLRTIDRPGDYCMQGRLLVPMPRVEVEGARSLSFPITEEQARSLAAAAEPAPYGRGEETLVDGSVRACRQVDAARVRITGGAWHDTLAKVVGQAAAGLGCPPEHTSAELYKLLVYEPGGFFAPHRDTEKVDGMVATLVVSLPVAGAGGELVIRHREREAVVDLHTEEPSELAFAAFYADCVHEIRPVTAGHRIVLVYHLVVRGAAAAVLRAAPDFGAQEEQIGAQLRNWEATSAAGDKLVWLLEHQYSEAGLSFDVLKNADGALGRVLARAAQRANHVLFAAILSIYEWGTVDDSGDFPVWDDHDDYDRNDEDDEDWDDEQIVSTREMYGLVAPDGSRPDYGALPLLAEELLPAGALDGVEPDHEDTKVTGNEGVQRSRSYRRAALVLWPRGRTLGTLARGGIERGVACFADDLGRLEDDPGARRHLCGLAAQLIDTWPEPDSMRFYRRQDTDGAQQGLRDALRLLRRLGDEATTRRFLHEVATRHYSSGENDELLATAIVVAPATLQAWMPAFTSENFAHFTEGVLDLLWRLCPRADSPAEASEHRRPALAAATRSVCGTLPEVIGAVADVDASPGFRPASSHVRPLSAQAIRALLGLVWYCAPAAANEVAALLVQQPAAAPPDRALPQALAELAEHGGVTGAVVGHAGFKTMWRHAANFLLARSAAPPEQPRDWVIETRIACDCEHCTRLQAFCADPADTTIRFRMRQDLRLHVESTIETGKLDIDCQTERRGSPHTLICTKNRATYDRRCAQYAEDIAHMRLLAAAPRSEADSVGAGDLRRLQMAIARAGDAAPGD